MAVVAVSIASYLILAAGAVLQPFDLFMQARGRTYRAGSAEYAERRTAYDGRVAKAELQNRQPDKLWTAGVNEYWDWTDAELMSLLGWRGEALPSTLSGGARRARPVSLLRGNVNGNATSAINTSLPDESTLPALPTEKSWLHLNSARTYRNQGVCGSCWALAAAGVLEAGTEIHGKRRTFSVQEMVSCVPNPQQCGGTGGCQGSTVELAMDWILEHGLAQEHEIPYRQKNSLCTHGGHHASTNAASAFGLTGWQTLPKNKYLPLMQALVRHGPVAVSAAAEDWLFYVRGVFNGCPRSTVVNHAVVLYGYGEDSPPPTHRSVKYWKIQNSWGRDWGEDGFIRLMRHDDEYQWCGVNEKPEMGTGCLHGPPKVTVCGMCGILYDSVVAYFD